MPQSYPFYDRNTQPPSEGSDIEGYHIESELASTNCSYVFIGRNIDSNEKKVLKFIKCIRKNMERIEREVEIMKIANHPNILQLEDSFRYGAYMCLVSKYAQNHDLQQYIDKNYPNGVPEKMAINIFKQMLEAVNYLHKLNICHRDIKLDNFLVFESDLSYPKIVLTDFGFSLQFSEDEKGEEFCGTPEFIAPEIYNYEPYDTSVDIWSLGVSLYKLLTDKLPFSLSTKSPKELMVKIQKGRLNIDLLKDQKISEKAINLIHKMCTVNPDKRIKSELALKHDWINQSKQN